jgi:hypothetical protein
MLKQMSEKHTCKMRDEIIDSETDVGAAFRNHCVGKELIDQVIIIIIICSKLHRVLPS